MSVVFSFSCNRYWECTAPGGGGGTSMFSVPGMCRWTGYSFHHSCSRAGYRFLQKCSQKGILFSNFCSQTGLQCIFLILCSQTGCGFLQFCSQTGVFKMRKMLPDRVKITAPQRHTPVHIRTKCPPPRVHSFVFSDAGFSFSKENRRKKNRDAVYFSHQKNMNWSKRRLLNVAYCI